MEHAEHYTPVGCSFIDHIEIFASERKRLELVYFNELNEPVSVETILRTWETREKVEYLLTYDGLTIRLDRVIMIAGISNDGACSI